MTTHPHPSANLVADYSIGHFTSGPLSFHGDTSRVAAALLAAQFNPGPMSNLAKRLMAEGVTILQWAQGRADQLKVATTLMCGPGILTCVTDHPGSSEADARIAALQWLAGALNLDYAQSPPDAETPSVESATPTEPPAPPAPPSDVASAPQQPAAPISESSTPPTEAPPETAPAPAEPVALEEPAGLTEGERHQITRLKAAVDSGSCAIEKARASLSEGGVSFSRLSPASLSYARALILGEPLRPAPAGIDPVTGF